MRACSPIAFGATVFKIEVVVPSSGVDKAIEAIVGAAKTGQIGDGKIFVTPVEHTLRIRTGETDDNAL